MASTLTGSGELTYLSFNIDKVESTPDGDLYVYGKATDGSVDHDQQIVDPSFSAKAIADWLATGGNVRVQHNPQRDPAGRGVSINTDPDGATWVKAEVVEPIAKKLVSKGVLRAYSVGIANPTIERDVTGKARGGIIKNGKIVEISLVDRPANASCGVQLVKSATDGTAEFTGQLFGETAEIQKALAGPAYEEAVNNIDKFEAPADISLDFTPTDMMRIFQEKLAYKNLVAEEQEILGKDHREFSADRRRNLAGQGNALPDGSYPIPDKDALRRAAILARSGHGNVSAARRLIARRAKELGVSNPLDSDDKEKTAVPAIAPVFDADGNITGDAAKEDVPDITKDPAKKPKKGKKMPPWLNKPADGDDSSCKMDHVHTEKCHTDPKTASGAAGGADMSPAPVGELLESPKPAHMKAAAILRYKTLGIDTELGILHDLTCEAFHPDEVAKYHPGADFSTAVDEKVWQERALHAVTSQKSSLSGALEAQQVVQAALALKTGDQQDLHDFRVEMYKAFRDANPGPTSYPTPGAISPEKYRRGCITAGHSSNGNGYDGPNSGPVVASAPPSASHFDRPPLRAGQQSPSPSFMKNTREDYATEAGTLHSITDGEIHREKARRAISMMHDHLMHMFPSLCPVDDLNAYAGERPTQLPPTVGVSTKSESDEPEILGAEYKYIRKLEKKVQAGEITEAEARDRLARKTAEKYARDLAKQVEKGLTSKDAVLRALGIEVPVTKTIGVISGTAEESPVQLTPVQKMVTAESLAPLITPDLIKSMMTEVLKPFEDKLNAQNEHIGTQNQLLTEYQEKFAAQEKELAEQRSRWDALASQPDPSSAAFTGLALNPAHQRPAVTKQADINERVQGMMMRQLERAWRTSENPAEREAAYKALMQYKGNTEL